MKTVKVVCGYCQKTPMGFRELDESYQPDFTYAIEFGRGQITACCEKCQVLLRNHGHYEAMKLARK